MLRKKRGALFHAAWLPLLLCACNGDDGTHVASDDATDSAETTSHESGGSSGSSSTSHGDASSSSGTNSSQGSSSGTASSSASDTTSTSSSDETSTGSSSSSGTTSGTSDTTSGTSSTSGSSDSSSSDSSSDTGDDGGAWRPFNDQSPWNTPIGSDAELHSNSDALIDDLAVSSQWNWLGINIAEFSIPVFEADANAPRVAVQVRDVTGHRFDMMVPIPENAMPDAASDRHLCILDRAGGYEYGMWDAWKDNDGWHCGVGAATELAGSGVRPPKDGNQDWTLSHGARACGFPLIAGLIRVEEIQAGRIEHALVLAYPHIRSRYYTPPASTAQATFSTTNPDEDGIPCGGRVQLNPDLDLDTLGLSESGKVVARALQEYGAYVADYSGAISLYAENSAEAKAIWEAGLLDDYEIRDQIDLQQLRVLQWGTLYDDMN